MTVPDGNVERSRPDDPDEASKRVPPPPMPRDKGGWQVAPAPDGRGAPGTGTRRPMHRLPWFWIAFALLLLFNWAVFRMAQPGSQPRVGAA